MSSKKRALTKSAVKADVEAKKILAERAERRAKCLAAINEAFKAFRCSPNISCTLRPGFNPEFKLDAEPQP